MYKFNEKYVQIWRESEGITLINHMWFGVEYFSRYGFKSIYQSITEEQLDVLLNLHKYKSEEIFSSIGKSKYDALVKFKYIVDENEELKSKPIDYSVQGDNLSSYLKSLYGIEQMSSPTKIQLLLTYRCFGNCSFCITNSTKVSRVEELSDDDWEKVARKIVEQLHPCQVDLIGGEPLLREKAVLKICKILVENNIMVRIITNGIVLKNKNFCAELSSILKGRRHYIQISIDGNEKEHNKIRPGAKYKDIIEGIKELAEFDLIWGANITITKSNQHCLFDIFNDIRDYYPCHFEIGPLQTSVKDMDLCKSIVLDKNDEMKLMETIDKLKVQYPDVDIVYNKRIPIYETGENAKGENQKYQMCSSFDKLLSIGADGRVIPCLRGCVHPEFYAENVLKEDLDYIWKNGRLKNIFQRIELKGKCKHCEYNQQCSQGCPLETYVLTGVLGGYNPNCTYEPKSNNEI